MTKFILALILTVTSAFYARAASASTQTSVFYKEISQWSNDALQKKALHYVHDEMPDSAFVCYTVMASRLGLQDLSDDDLLKSVMAVNNMGYLYYFFYHDYQKAFLYLNKALRASEDYHQEEAQEAIYINLANVYRLYSDYLSINDYSDKIISYYKKALYLSRKYHEDRFMLICFYGLAHYAYWTGKIEDIKQEMQLIRTLKIDPNFMFVKFDRDFCDAIDCLEARRYPDALKHLQDMLKHNDARDTPVRYDIMTYQRMADVCLKMSAYREAEGYLQQAERLAQKQHSEDLLVYLYKEYIRLYSQKHNDAKKADYENKYLRCKDKLMNEGKLKMVEKMHFMQELDKANEKVVGLYHERQRHRIIFLAILAVALILMASVAVLTVNYRKLNASYRQLYQRNVEMLEMEEKKRHQTAVKGGKTSPSASAADATQETDVPDESLKALQDAIDNVLNNNKEIFSFDFDLSRLAELTGTKYWTLSKSIKEIYGKNFNTLLGEYRIREACRRLNDFEHYGNYSIGGIAVSVGFRSRPNFVNTFKSIVGMTPTEYKKIAINVKK